MPLHKTLYEWQATPIVVLTKQCHETQARARRNYYSFTIMANNILNQCNKHKNAYIAAFCSKNPDKKEVEE